MKKLQPSSPQIDLTKLIPVARPDVHTIVCHMPGVMPGNAQRTVVTLRRSLEFFTVVLDISVTLGSALSERTVRVHRAAFTEADVAGWSGLEQAWSFNTSTLADRDRAAAVALLAASGVFPKLETK